METVRDTAKDTARTIRRLLHHLHGASMELESLAADDRLKPEARIKFHRLKSKYVDWVSRDIRTDMKSYEHANMVSMDLDSDRANSLKQIMDLCFQYENIGDIYDVLVEGVKEPVECVPVVERLKNVDELTASMNC